MSGKSVMIEEPKVAKLLFSDARFGWLWRPGQILSAPRTAKVT